MAADAFAAAVRAIESVPDRPGSAGGFEEIARAFAELPAQPPADGRKIALIAGTNGKGTTARMLAALLDAAGERTGLYTSPHLIKPNERIWIGGRDLTDAEFVRAYERVRSVCERRRLGRFEAMTAMAIDAFFGGAVAPKATAAVFEVGVGGRLDCTNAIPHEVAAIARIGFDHEAILGSTIGAIAREKHAIARGSRRAVFLDDADSEIEASRAQAQREFGAEWTKAQTMPLAPVELDAKGEPAFALQTPWGRAPLPVPGERAAECASLALAAFAALGFDPGRHFGALANARWPGRMERFPSPCPRGAVYLSGDHNPQGARSLAQLLRHWRYESVRFVVGIGANKNASGIIEELERIPRAQLSFTRVPFRGADRESYARPASPYDEDPLAALERAERACGPGDLVVATGSLYLIGALREKLLARG